MTLGEWQGAHSPIKCSQVLAWKLAHRRLREAQTYNFTNRGSNEHKWIKVTKTGITTKCCEAGVDSEQANYLNNILSDGSIGQHRVEALLGAIKFVTNYIVFSDETVEQLQNKMDR